MVKLLTRFLLLCLSSLLLFTFTIIPKGTSKKIQELHIKISNDLVGIRKKFPKSQLVVYSVLDQVCSMYSLSKNVIHKKKTLKKGIIAQNREYNNIRVKSLTLKNKLLKVANELHQYQKNQTTNVKNLEQKDLLIAQLSKDKETLLTIKKKLEIEMNHLKLQLNSLQTSSHAQNKDDGLSEDSVGKDPEYLNKIYSPNMKKRNNITQNNYNLNLTSSSDPISPL